MLSKLSQLLQGEWWKSMYGALLRTLIAGLAPFLLAYAGGQPVVWFAVLSQIVLLLIMTVLTSLSGIPVPATAPYWEVLGARFLRQFAQFLVAGIGTVLLFSDVPWQTLLLGALASAVATALIGSLTVIPATPIILTGEIVGTPAVVVYNQVLDADPKYAVVDDTPVGP